MELRGFDELKAALAALPEASKRASAPILLRHAQTAEQQVVTAYPEVTGNLRAGVKVIERQAHGVAALYTLVTSSPHAHLYEFGTVHQRPRATFLPITERERRDAVVAVADMVEAQGLVVRVKRD
jgi:hypothetical protein